ncbi:MAG: AMP-dependent synthetase and ligase [Myxococcales bacterium]|nr:AMP-dependent synthetase and ligase [Myxococcales bacterium]
MSNDAADCLAADDAAESPAGDALSIRAAASEAGNRPAIITASKTLTFADCEREVQLAGSRGVTAISATPTIETILAIYAALEARRPIALMHPRLASHELDRQRAEVAAAQLPDGAAIVLFTSGSTGAARGVVLTRAALIAAAGASAAHLGWTDDDRWLLCLPLAHAGGLSIVIRCLAARRPIVFHDADFAPREVAALARGARATLASLVPTQLAALLDHIDGSEPLRAVLIGGAAASPTQVQAAIARGLPIRTSYGLTETFGQVATAPSCEALPRPLPGVELAAGTREHPALIRIRGPMLAMAYLDGAPIAPELVTADLGYLDDDGLHVLGRADDVIITGGENVHPAEIESVVATTPGVLAACAFGLADPIWGQIVAVALTIDGAFDPELARTRWQSTLPPHARPRQVLIVETLPLLPSGKVDRRAATELALAVPPG